MTDMPLSLAGDFLVPTREQWETEVLKVLNRKRPAGKELTIDQALARLRTTMVDGATIEPLYTEHPGPLGLPGVAPFTRGATLRAGAWDVRALHEDPDVAFTKEQIKADLTRGATSLWLRVDSDAIKPDDLAALLADVEATTPVAVTSREDQAKAADALLAVWASKNAQSAARGNLGIDPLRHAAQTGEPAQLGLIGDYAKAAAAFPGVRPVVVNVTLYTNAGAGDIQQLAFAAATGVAYLRALEDAGVPLAEAVGKLEFRVSADTEEFMTIARLRAFRRIWSRIVTSCGVDAAAAGAIQHAVTSWRMISRDDPWVNLLRGTIATFSAAVGGAEAITCLPFDTAHGLPTDFSRRLARNTQIVVAEESNIGRVNDAAGGAWVFENLTDELAAKGWELFQQIEAAGGMEAALASGMIAGMIGEVAAERAKRLATRKLPLTGVSMFPRESEDALEVRPRPAAPVFGGLKLVRDPEVFEALRDRAAAASPAPMIFLACLGERRDFGGREMFTSALLGVAGIVHPSSEGGTPEEIVANVKQAGARMAIMCSSAGIYAEQAIPVAKALKDAGVEVWIAGRRAETGSDEADAVIAGEVFDGMDVIEFLGGAMDRMEVAK